MKIYLLLLITCILWGTTPILEKIGLTNGVDPMIGVAIRSFGISLFLLLFLSVQGKLNLVLSYDIKSILIFVLTGIMAGCFGMMAYFYALKLGATSKIVPIAASYPMITAILSIIILKEGISVYRLLGTALILAGIWLVKT